jgi:hypothetical protein
MKAITLTQPWASLVAIGAKRIETRSWNTKYRGPLAIHAAKGFPEWAKDFSINHFTHIPNELPLGMIIATCELVECLRINENDDLQGKNGWMIGGHFWEASPQEILFGNFEIHRYMWFLNNVVRLAVPVPAKGMLGLWEWEEEQKQKM